MDNPHLVTQDYRDRWSELPEGQYDLHSGDVVNKLPYCGIGSYPLLKDDGTQTSISGFAGHILRKINIEEAEARIEYNKRKQSIYN